MPANLATNQATNTKGAAVAINGHCTVSAPGHTEYGNGDCNIEWAKLDVDADFAPIYTFNVRSETAQRVEINGDYFLRTNIHNASVDANDPKKLDVTIEVQ